MAHNGSSAIGSETRAIRATSGAPLHAGPGNGPRLVPWSAAEVALASQPCQHRQGAPSSSRFGVEIGRIDWAAPEPVTGWMHDLPPGPRAPWRPRICRAGPGLTGQGFVNPAGGQHPGSGLSALPMPPWIETVDARPSVARAEGPQGPLIPSSNDVDSRRRGFAPRAITTGRETTAERAPEGTSPRAHQPRHPARRALAGPATTASRRHPMEWPTRPVAAGAGHSSPVPPL